MLAWPRQKVFQFVHSNNLIYNQCWEDPRLDHEALEISHTDNVLLITSAGCNVLDYLLKKPARIDSVDMNPRQNALLELKIAALRHLAYDDFFQLFGYGQHAQASTIYENHLRSSLSPYAQKYWDKNIEFFSPSGWRSSFYYHGTSGLIARLMNHYVDIKGMKELVSKAFQAQTLQEQKEIYFSHLKPLFWNNFLRWVSRRGATMSALGVPRSQFLQIEQYYQGGMAKFIEDCLESVFAQLPLKDNYFWHLYLFGSYSKSCCPEYLKEENFPLLQEQLSKVHIHTSSILDFLKKSDHPLHKVSLLDHMDWLYQNNSHILEQQWQNLLSRTPQDSRIIWRSASLNVDFVNPLPVKVNQKWSYVGDHLSYDTDKAQRLHKSDRVHTYGSFYITQVQH